METRARGYSTLGRNCLGYLRNRFLLFFFFDPSSFSLFTFSTGTSLRASLAQVRFCPNTAVQNDRLQLRVFV